MCYNGQVEPASTGMPYPVPPAELIKEWEQIESSEERITVIGQWYADRELDAVRALIRGWYSYPGEHLKKLNAARRPSKEQILEKRVEEVNDALQRIETYAVSNLNGCNIHKQLVDDIHCLRELLNDYQKCVLSSLPGQ